MLYKDIIICAISLLQGWYLLNKVGFVFNWRAEAHSLWMISSMWFHIHDILNLIPNYCLGKFNPHRIFSIVWYNVPLRFGCYLKIS